MSAEVVWSGAKAGPHRGYLTVEPEVPLAAPRTVRRRGTQHSVVAMLEAGPAAGLTARQIAEQDGVDVWRVNAALYGLRVRGLVERDQVDREVDGSRSRRRVFRYRLVGRG